MKKNKLTINSLFNQLTILDLNRLFYDYQFFIVYDALTNQKNYLKNKNLVHKTQFFCKITTKICLFFFVFDNKHIKYPLFIRFINNIHLFENIIMTFLLKKFIFIYLRYKNLILSSIIKNFFFFKYLFNQLKNLIIYDIFFFDRVILF
jgi:hypothetical protein